MTYTSAEAFLVLLHVIVLLLLDLTFDAGKDDNITSRSRSISVQLIREEIKKTYVLLIRVCGTIKKVKLD